MNSSKRQQKSLLSDIRSLSAACWTILSVTLFIVPPADAQQPNEAGFRTQAEERAIFVEKLRRDIAKVSRAVEVTEELISRSRGAPYLPDIYLRLAELYVEQSRYEFYLIHEERSSGSSGAAVAPTARLLKEKAIETYRRILSDFPDWKDNDKVTFFMAHEFRELGRYEDMIATFRRLTAAYPKSSLILDAYLVLGDYRFDKSDLDGAEIWYQKILNAPQSPTHDLAHFKMGWVELNRASFREAFEHFESAVETPWAPPGGDRQDARRLDVKREALADLAYTYTEVKPASQALRYFGRLAPSRSLYVLALDKLARRYFIKQRFANAAGIYRELARLSNDPIENLDRTSQVYQAVIKAQDYNKIDQDIEHMLAAADQYRFDWRVKESEREAAARDVELQARDLATRAQQYALKTKNRRLGIRVAKAYERYLESFPDNARQAEIIENLADTLYESKKFLKAGDNYEEAALLRKEGRAKQEALYNACAAFRQALEVGGPTLPRFERLWAQRGLIQNGRDYVERYPKSSKVAEIELNIGRSYFEGGEFERAVGVFEEFLDRRPKDRRAETVADLILDAFAQQKDYEGLAVKAKALAARGIGGRSFRKRMLDTAKAAEERQIGEVILTASVDDPGREDAGERLRNFWEDNQASPVAEKTLYTAFVQFKEARDYAQLFATGNQFIGAYPKSTYLGDVFGTLAAFTSQVGAFDKAAVYLEELEARFPKDVSARRQLAQAARLRQLLGDHEGAVNAYRRLFNTSKGATARARNGEALLVSLRELKRWPQVVEVAKLLSRQRVLPVQAALYRGLAARNQGQKRLARRFLTGARREAGRASNPKTKAAAAEAAFLLGEMLLEEFRAADANPSIETAAATKAELLGRLEKAMVEAAGFGVGQWAVAGLNRVAIAYAEMSQFLAQAPAPPELTPAEQAQFRRALSQQVGAFETRAEELFVTCVERALSLGIMTADTRGCIARGPPNPIPRVQLTTGIRTNENELRSLETSLTLRPKDLDALKSMVEHFLAEDDGARAKLMAGRGLELDDRDARLYNLIGAAELSLGKTTEAYAAFGRAAELGHPYAAINQAAILADIGAQRAAQELLDAESVDTPPPEQAVDLHPRAALLLGRTR